MINIPMGAFEPEKQCAGRNGCGRYLPLAAFASQTVGGQYGRQTMCRECSAATSRAWRERNPARVREGNAVRYATRSPEYRSWSAMKRRCLNPADVGYENYGGRGIWIDHAWTSFRSFLAWMGLRPAGTTLGRRDPNGHYVPGNVRWETRAEQAMGKRNTLWLETEKIRMPLLAWARHLNVSAAFLRNRKRLGWTDDETVSTPKGTRRPRKPDTQT
ncbi:hypothetical protein [Variovorax paradoxus]|uniref:hypothetical protein n=1 Tax=Variovorax paradoxus TaxID=34073 RepID=UPI00277D84B0|nr:hypothetical protein [Variovorax paradoxus]MDQ0591364.1 hypothetical protein [Variovorax paradoxus]